VARGFSVADGRISVVAEIRSAPAGPALDSAGGGGSPPGDDPECTVGPPMLYIARPARRLFASRQLQRFFLRRASLFLFLEIYEGGRG
jgi:hypothetical protein